MNILSKSIMLMVFGTSLISFNAHASKEEAVSLVAKKCQSQALGRGKSFFFDCSCVVQEFSENYESHRSSWVSATQRTSYQDAIDSMRALGKEPPPSLLEAHEKELERRRKSPNKDPDPRPIAERGFDEIINDSTCLSRQRLVAFGEEACSGMGAIFAKNRGESIDCGCTSSKFVEDYTAYAQKVESSNSRLRGSASKFRAEAARSCRK